MQTDLNNIYKFLTENSTKIAEDVTNFNFREVKNYQNSKITSDDSVNDTKKFIDYIAECIKILDLDTEAMKEYFDFIESVADKRVKSNINAMDLLEAIIQTRTVVWEWIETKAPAISNPKAFFLIEKRINSMIDKFSIDVTKKFLDKQNLLIKEQENSLKIWEEVVRRTSHLDLKIPCTGEFVLIARAQAEAIASRLSMTSEEIQDFVLVIGEACDNAIEHGVSEKGVDIRYVIMPNEIVVKITDYGKGFDPTGKGEEIPDLFSERGRGIFLMKTLSTSVNIDSKIGDGTTVTIHKQRNNAPILQPICCN